MYVIKHSFGGGHVYSEAFHNTGQSIACPTGWSIPSDQDLRDVYFIRSAGDPLPPAELNMPNTASNTTGYLSVTLASSFAESPKYLNSTNSIAAPTGQAGYVRCIKD